MRGSFHAYDDGPLLIVNASQIDPVNNEPTTSSYFSKLKRRRAVAISLIQSAAASPEIHLCIHNLNNAAWWSLPLTVGTLQQDEAGRRADRLSDRLRCELCRLVDAAGTDLVLVGDSLGMVIQGHDTTVPVTVDNIVYHCGPSHEDCAVPFSSRICRS